VDRNIKQTFGDVDAYVALLAEGVDRNIISWRVPFHAAIVALLAEGVDRNTLSAPGIISTCTVALLAEGVDRNTEELAELIQAAASPSSRRAWIEIGQTCRPCWSRPSPSSRRAWIEIP